MPESTHEKAASVPVIAVNTDAKRLIAGMDNSRAQTPASSKRQPEAGAADGREVRLDF
jgi:hypothetical protein